MPAPHVHQPLTVSSACSGQEGRTTMSFTFTPEDATAIRSAYLADNGALDTVLHTGARVAAVSIAAGASLVDVARAALAAPATDDGLKAAKSKREWVRRQALLGSFAVATPDGYSDARTVLYAAITAKVASADAMKALAESRVWGTYAEVQAALQALLPVVEAPSQGETGGDEGDEGEAAAAERQPKSLDDWLLETAGALLRRSDRESVHAGDALGALAVWALVEATEAAPAPEVVEALRNQVAEAYSRALRASTPVVEAPAA